MKNLLKVLKYAKIIPMIIFPYITFFSFLFVALIVVIFQVFDIDTSIATVVIYISLFVSSFIQLITFVASVIGAIRLNKQTDSVQELALINLGVKAFHLAVFALFFIFKFCAGLLALWGFPVIIVIDVIEIVSVLMSAFNSLACAKQIKKEKIMKPSKRVFLTVLSFFMITDVIAAAIYFKDCVKFKNTINKNITYYEIKEEVGV